MKRYALAALMLLTPVASHAQFAFNRKSCVVNVVTACIQVDATFNPTSTGTFVSMRLHVDQQPANASDQTAVRFNYFAFDDRLNHQDNTYEDIPWLAMYGNVQTPSPIQHEDMPWMFAGDGLFAAILPYTQVAGCTQPFPVNSFQMCDSQFGYGALEVNWFAPRIYDASILSRVRVWGDGLNAAGQRIGLGCMMDVLGSAQGDGPWSPSAQPEGQNFCNTTDEFESLAVGPRTVLTTPEPGTYALMFTGLLAVGYARRRRNRAA